MNETVVMWSSNTQGTTTAKGWGGLGNIKKNQTQREGVGWFGGHQEKSNTYLQLKPDGDAGVGGEFLQRDGGAGEGGDSGTAGVDCAHRHPGCIQKLLTQKAGH